MLFKSNTTKDVVLELLQYSSALQYQTVRFVNQFKQGLEEIEMIALYLCGTSNKHLAIAFMNGFINEELFYSNVANNAEECVPVILRAINIRLVSQALEDLKNECQLNSFESEFN